MDFGAPRRDKHVMDIYGIAWDFMARQCLGMGQTRQKPHISWGKLREKPVDNFDEAFCARKAGLDQDFEKRNIMLKIFLEKA